MNHTPEPWHTNGSEIIDNSNKGLGETYQTLSKGTDETNANAARIVACVNALAGIEDPAATLAEVRDLLNQAADTLCDEGHAFLSAECFALLAKLGTP